MCAAGHNTTTVATRTTKTPVPCQYIVYNGEQKKKTRKPSQPANIQSTNQSNQPNNHPHLVQNINTHKHTHICMPLLHCIPLP